ncbi:MAG: BON domain-containing protein [Planctomycetia bacterium]|nr:BON domain-containing protein [Planctomycetia bacterium]
MRRVILSGAILWTAALLPMVTWGSNQEMAEKIANVLQEDSLTDGCDIGLKFQNETVWLTGVVDDASKIAEIENAIESLAGVSKVINRLEVEKEVIADSEVQQTAGYQRSIVKGTPAVLQDIPGAEIISDEVVVSDVPVNGQEQIIATSTVPTALPAASHDSTAAAMSELAAKPVQTTQLQGSGTPVALKKVSYGTTVTEAPAVSYGMGGMPQPMNPQAYNMQYRTSASMQYDNPHMPNKAWPSYAAYPNTAAVQYPKRHTHKAWPYVGPYYPYPQVPDGWRKVTLEWHDGYWHLDFDDGTSRGPFNGLFRQKP